MKKEMLTKKLLAREMYKSSTIIDFTICNRLMQQHREIRWHLKQHLHATHTWCSVIWAQGSFGKQLTNVRDKSYSCHFVQMFEHRNIPELTDSTQQSLLWQANSHSASQETPALNGNRNFITVFKRARPSPRPCVTLRVTSWFQTVRSC